MARQPKRKAAPEPFVLTKTVRVRRKVFLLNTVAQPGEVVTLDAPTADRLISKGMADVVSNDF
jgi:hypothetical protein